MLDPTMPPPMIATSAVRMVTGHCKWEKKWTGENTRPFSTYIVSELGKKGCGAHPEQDCDCKPTEHYRVGCSRFYFGDAGQSNCRQDQCPDCKDVKRRQKAVKSRM